MRDAVTTPETQPSPIHSPLRSRTFLAAVLLCLGAVPAPAASRPHPLDARVVWTRGVRAYVASHDSLTLTPFTLLTFTSRGEPLATGEVERVMDGAMALVRITSGSLARVKHLDRLRIVVETPGGLRLLRVGYPSRRRAHLLFACERLVFDPPAKPWTGRMELDSSTYRLVRDPEDVTCVLWPETLLVRLYDDAADQEIAIERGELDVAVFWPGEISTHMREHQRWKDRLSWPLQRGLVGAIWLGPDSVESRCTTALREASAFEALNQSLFRGDLLVSRDVAAWCSDTTPAHPAAQVRYEVDASCPGRVVLERSLNRDAPGSRAAGAQPVVHVFYLDARPFHADEMILAAAEHIRRGSFTPALRARADSLAATVGREYGKSGREDPGWPIRAAWDSLGLTFPIAMECQVLCEPRLVPYVSDLGAGVLVDLFDCLGPARTP